MARAAWTQIIASKLFHEFFVTVYDTMAAADMGLGGMSPSSAYWSFRKQGRLSSSSLCRMALPPIGVRTESFGLCQNRCTKSRRLDEFAFDSSEGSEDLVGDVQFL